MTRHLHPEQLAGIALGEPDDVTTLQRAHLLVCRRCRSELAELRHVVTTGRETKPYTLRSPRPETLGQIQAQLDSDAGGRQQVTPAPVGGWVAFGPGHVLTVPRRADRRLVSASLAAVALAAVAVGGVVWYRQAPDDEPVVVATASLQPLPDKSGHGTAELIRRNGTEELAVTVTAAVVSNQFEELWLLNTDGRRMISLGVVPPDGRASFSVPSASAGSLDGYTIVDVSLEPMDGNAAHSKNSLLRGTLH